MIDLRKHGGSQDFSPPHTIAACASDVAALQESIGRFDAILGHSFGGKVALELGRAQENLKTIWTIDSSPGARPDRRGSETTLQIVKMIETLPERFPTREAFIAYVEERGTTRPIALWLAMNVRAAADGNGYEMRVDVPALRSLLDDYFNVDLWPVIEDPKRTNRIEIVAAGRSNVLDSGERARAQRDAAAHPARTRFHLLPNSGHWAQVDAPDELFRLVADYT